jgi:hypothetical protein
LRTVLLQAQELPLQALADDRVDRAEGLVHEQHRRVGGQRAGHPDPLPLPAGQLVRVAPGVGVRVQPDQLEQLLTAGPRPRPVPAQQLRHGRHVVQDRAVREQPGGLDDVADPPPELDLVDGRDVLTVQDDPARRRLDEAVDHLQGGRLAAARGADQGDQGALRDVEVEGADGHRAVVVALRDAVEPDHGLGGTVHRHGPLGGRLPAAQRLGLR